MKRLGWMAGAKALAATTALACGAMLASTAAQADYSYTFSISNTSSLGFNNEITPGPASGTFTTTGLPGTPSFISVTSGANTFTVGGMVYNGSGGYTANSASDFFNFNNGPNMGLGFGGYSLTYTSNTISGTVGLREYTDNSGSTNIYGQGSFLATLIPSSPSGGSGGAPTPEVNAGLGILIAGASFAFLRRKRGTGHEATTA